MHSEDSDLKYAINLIFYTEGISFEAPEQSINFTGKGQRIGIAFATSSKTELDEGTFESQLLQRKILEGSKPMEKVK